MELFIIVNSITVYFVLLGEKKPPVGAVLVVARKRQLNGRLGTFLSVTLFQVSMRFGIA